MSEAETKDKPKKNPNIRKRRLFPRTLQDCVNPLVKPALKANGFSETSIINDWEKIVGEQLAKTCLPHRITFPKGVDGGGSLTVLAPSALSTEIQHLEPLILERIATYFGYRAVIKIRIQHAAPQMFRTKEQKVATRPAPGTGSPELNNIEDEVLRGALAQLQGALQRNKR